MELRSANLLLRFLVELAAMAAFSYWGFHSGRGWVTKGGLGIGVPLLAAIVWGIFGAPRSPMRVTGAFRLMLEVCIFGLAAASLMMSDRPVIGAAFAVIALLNTILLHVWKQD